MRIGWEFRACPGASVIQMDETRGQLGNSPRMARALVLLLLLLWMAPARACTPGGYLEASSPNGRYRVEASWGLFGARQRFHDGAKELWNLDLSLAPERIFVDDEGRFVYLAGQRLELHEGKSGRLLRELTLPGTVLWLEGVRDGWFAAGSRLLLETELERVLSWSLDDGSWRWLEASELPALVRRGEHPRAALRLAAVHRLPLDAPGAGGPEADAYAWRLRGDLKARARLGLVDLQDEGSLLLLLGSEEENLQRLEAGGPQAEAAAAALGAMRSCRAVPALTTRATHDYWSERSLILILGDDAAPILARRPKSNLAWDFFSRVHYPPVVPALIEQLPPHPRSELLQALKFQTRTDLADPQAWKAWLLESQRKTGLERGRALSAHGERSGPLWLARTAGDVSALTATPRLIGVFPARKTENVSLVQGVLRRLDGRADDDVLSWDVASGEVRSRLPRKYSDRFTFHQGDDGDALLVDDGERIEAWYRGKSWSIRSGIMAVSRNGLWATLTPGPGYLVADRLMSLRSEKVWPLKETSRGRFTDDSRWLLVPLTDVRGEEPVFDVSSDDSQLLEPDHSPFLPRFSPDGRWVLRGEKRGITVQDRQGRPQGGCEGWLLGCRPDSSLAAVGDGRTVALRELPSLRERGRVPLTGSSVTFSDDGRYLALVGWDDCIRVLELNPRGWGAPDDPQLLSELWTGLRLQGGSAVEMTPEEYLQRLQRWGPGWTWGPPPPTEAWRQAAAAAVQSCLGVLGIVVLAGAAWFFRRGSHHG